MASDSDMTSFLSGQNCSMMDVSNNCFPLIRLHVSLEVHVLDLDFILTQTVLKSAYMTGYFERCSSSME
jgi:hypothetical protein